MTKGLQEKVLAVVKEAEQGAYAAGKAAGLNMAWEIVNTKIHAVRSSALSEQQAANTEHLELVRNEILRAFQNAVGKPNTPK